MKIYIKANQSYVNHISLKDCKILTQNQYEAQKNYLDYQFKKDGYRFYSKPGKEQYTWLWYAVPYGKETTTE